MNGSKLLATKRRIFLAMLGCVMLAHLGGCSYSAETLYPQQYTTVAVPVFENRTFYQGVNFDLSEALVKQIEQTTPYKVVAPGSADTQIQGVIVNITQTQLSRRRGGGGVGQEIEVELTCDFQWKDLRTGKIIRDRKGFSSVGRHLPTAGFGEPIDIALQQAADRLATDIVSTMQSDW